jgi:hypothetical protein
MLTKEPDWSVLTRTTGSAFVASTKPQARRGAVPRGSKLFGEIAQLIPPLRNLSLMVRYKFDADPA